MALQFTSNNRATLIALGSPRSITDPARDIAVTDYGALGDGVTDDTAAITSAATAASTATLPLHFPAGTYLVSGAIDCSGIPVVYGDGKYISKIKATSVAMDVLSKNSSSATTFRDLMVTSSVTKTAGAGIKLTGNAVGDTIAECVIELQYVGINVDAAIGYVIDHNYIVSCISKSINILNSVDVDAGDGFIRGNTLTGGGATYAIYQQSSGGLIVAGNKILTHGYGFFLDVVAGGAASILDISNNSFDAQTTACIAIQSLSTGTWDYITIADNIMNAPYGILLEGTSANIKRVQIINNTIAYTTRGIEAQAGNYINIEGNMLEAGVADAVAIYTNATWPTTVTIGENYYINTVNRHSINGNTGVRFAAAKVVLGGLATGVNLNSGNTDTAITINSPTPNYRINAVLVVNTGTTASLTTVTAGLFTTTGGGGLALAANQALAAITANAVNTDANALSLTATVGIRTKINSTTLQFRVGTAQGAAATGDVYVYIQPMP